MKQANLRLPILLLLLTFFSTFYSKVFAKKISLENVNETGDYRSHQNGTWMDVNSWERWDGSAWIYPAPAYPHAANAGLTTIESGDTITYSFTITQGSGYVGRIKVNTGGHLTVTSNANLSLANDGIPSTATTDLQVDGSLTLNGGLYTNGNISVLVNGTFTHTGGGR